MTELERYGMCTLDQDGCATCGDLGIPVRVVAVHESGAVCEDRTGRRTEIAVDFIPDVRPGDVLLIHMSVAIARVEEG